MKKFINWANKFNNKFDKDFYPIEPMGILVFVLITIISLTLYIIL